MNSRSQNRECHGFNNLKLSVRNIDTTVTTTTTTTSTTTTSTTSLSSSQWNSAVTTCLTASIEDGITEIWFVVEKIFVFGELSEPAELVREIAVLLRLLESLGAARFVHHHLPD